jgi:DNA-binding response OmpR family regulator
MTSTYSHQMPKTILVVDDEDGTRGLISLILREGGYAVLEAADCETAERIHQRHRGKIDLLLTDIGLPDADGCYLAAALREAEPELEVLFMSGMGQPEEFAPLLQKPFGVAELLRSVRNQVA